MNITPKHTLSLKAYLLSRAKMKRNWFGKLEIEMWMEDAWTDLNHVYVAECGMRRIRELVNEGYLEQSMFKGTRAKLAKYRII